MKRLVSVEKTESSVIYHFEDRELKEKFSMSESDIIAKSAQCNSSFFTNSILGIAWDTVND